MELGHFFYDLLVHNENFAGKSKDTDFSVYEDHQHPPITMLTCADSRIQGEILGMDLINKYLRYVMQVIRLQGIRVALHTL